MNINAVKHTIRDLTLISIFVAIITSLLYFLTAEQIAIGLVGFLVIFLVMSIYQFHNITDRKNKDGSL